MKRWYATSNVNSHSILHSAVDNLCNRVLRSQSNDSNYLHETVKSVINKYHVPLANYFGIDLKHYNKLNSKEEIWQKLMSLDTISTEIRSKRHDLLSLKNHQYRAPQVPYNNFLKALYPHRNRGSLGLSSPEEDTSSFASNAIKYELINHNLVYKYYCELPHPAPSYMKPNHLDNFLSRFLYRRDFIKPNLFSSSYVRSGNVMYSTYNEMLEHRSEHVAMCTKILNDMKESGLPLSIQEQNQFIFMSFFKDRADIIEKVENSIKELKETDGQNSYPLRHANDFDWNIYQLIKQQFNDEATKLNVDTYNTLLFIAMRHGRHDVVADILKNLGFDDILNNEKHILNEKNAAPDRETLDLILGYLSSKEFREISGNQNSISAFSKAIDYLANSNHITLDVRTINKVTKGLTDMKNIEEAEFLVSRLFIDPLFEDTEKTLLEKSNPELDLYKALTADDKQLYKKLLRLYDNLKQILSSQNIQDMEPYKLMPNEGSFRPLIYSYCSPNNDKNSFQKSVYIMNVLENQYGLPITTRIFYALFSKFIEINKHNSHDSSDWNLEALNHITVKLINSHDKSYGFSQDTIMRNKLDELVLSAQLKSFVNKTLDGKKLRYIPKERGNFVKLSDSMIHQVCQAYASVLNNDPTLTSLQRKEFTGTIELLRKDLLNDIKSLRSSHPSSMYKDISKQMVFINDEISYLKKGFLIDLIDLTYSI
ncbi:uncharacterized protein AC631_02828 [Debaryomyces fabryi]|uniref:Uncharacterized protein n=1 Tax=Debaryomyces fabryi TaxID=58627 RepID=A0A0V1PYQ0_9ASCO|nr:uncharacterized protein AC631_02828 [Debaryomyces fabryi]KSA01400.1 hypothetical protein AC631_02828 [Debaryomyces fabryi]CUM52838.1 unnamed protein product [Debaryomyces fabryi]